MRSEGRELKVDRAHSAPELVVAQARKNGREACSEKKKVAGWSTRVREVVASKQEFEDAEEMCSGEASARGYKCSLENCAKRSRRSWNKTVEEAKKSAYKGRGDPQEWRIVKKEQDFSQRGVKTVARNVSHCSENTACSGTNICNQAKPKRWGFNSK